MTQSGRPRHTRRRRHLKYDATRLRGNDVRCIYALAAVFAAVATHRCVDFLVAARLVRGFDHDYAHVAVGPVALAAIAMFAALLWFAVADRDRWFVSLVRSIEATPFRRSFVIVIGLAVAALFGMESVEQLVSLGHLEGGLTWLGTSVPIALSIFCSFAAGAALAMHRGARALADALDAVRAFAEIAIAQRARTRGAATFVRFAHFAAASHALVVVRVCGLRAPPLFR